MPCPVPGRPSAGCFSLGLLPAAAGPGPAASRGPPWVLVLAGGGGGVARSWRGLAAAPARPPWGSELAVAHGRCRAGRPPGSAPRLARRLAQVTGASPQARPPPGAVPRPVGGFGRPRALGGLSSAPGICPEAGPQADRVGGEAPRWQKGPGGAGPRPACGGPQPWRGAPLGSRPAPAAVRLGGAAGAEAARDGHLGPQPGRGPSCRMGPAAGPGWRARAPPPCFLFPGGAAPLTSRRASPVLGSGLPRPTACL